VLKCSDEVFSEESLLPSYQRG